MPSTRQIWFNTHPNPSGTWAATTAGQLCSNSFNTASPTPNPTTPSPTNHPTNSPTNAPTNSPTNAPTPPLSHTATYVCDDTKNFVPGMSYSQISLTDGCNGNICDANPKYG